MQSHNFLCKFHNLIFCRPVAAFRRSFLALFFRLFYKNPSVPVSTRQGDLALVLEDDMEERMEIGDVVSYNGLTFHVVDVAGTVIGISTVPNPGTTARVMWVSPTRVKKFRK